MFTVPGSRAIRQDLDAAALETFERLRRRQLRSRLRVAAWLGLGLAPLAIAGNVLFLPDRLPERVGGLGTIMLLDLAVLALLRTRVAWRHPGELAVGYIICLYACTLFLLSLSPGDLGTLVAPLGVMLVGTAVLFPWGAVQQAVLSAGTIAGFTLILFVAAPPGSTATAFNVGLSLVMMSTLAVATSGILQSHRFEACLHRWRVQTLSIQRRRLIQIGRELRETLDPEKLLERIAVHARRLVDADLVAIASRDLDGGTLRFTAADGDPTMEGLLGIDLPPAFAAEICASLARNEVQESPGSDIDPYVSEFMQSMGYARRLSVAVGPSHRLLGFLTWHRRDERPFTYLERIAAEGIADQAYTTLSAARLYARALESGRLKSEFVSTVSHEFRTPLSVIIGYAEMAGDPHISDDQKKMGLDGIQHSAQELLLLVEHTLDISRMDAGRDHLDLEQVELNALWRSLAEMCSHLPREDGVVLRWAKPLPSGIVRSDRRRMSIIVRNLVSNALKFTERGEVTIEAKIDGSDLILCVRDTGIGIAEKDQSVIFEIFRQADGSETRRYQGTGLGLYILSRFVEQLRGSVHVESVVGRGSSFEVRIPGVEAVHRPVFVEQPSPLVS